MKLFEICSDYEQLVDNINIEEKKELTNYNYKKWKYTMCRSINFVLLI